jgi:alpha-ketoglutaric semialdehyde dehydrogenase
MVMSIPELESYVDGRWRTGSSELPDINPADPAEHVAMTSQADADLAVSAVEAAARAIADWRATSAPARGEVLRRAGDLLDARADDIARDLSREEGKTKSESHR